MDMALSTVDKAAASGLVFKPAQSVLPAPFNWSGPYLGVHGGFGWGDEKDNQSHLICLHPELDRPGRSPLRRFPGCGL